MNLRMTAALAATLALAGCQKADEGARASMTGGKGRYVGVGMYPATSLWAQLVAPPPTAAGAATLDDDEQVIVVMDSATGEMRQCGNLSGHCIGFNPWVAPLPAGQGVPAALQKHASELAAEAEAELRQQRKPSEKP